ncbi:MAG TPA: alpha/beta hydrolase [Mycobacterium sp.]
MRRGSTSAVALASMLVLLVSLVTSCATKTAEFDYLRIQVDGQSVLAVSKRDVLVHGIVVFFHGVDQDEFTVTNDPHYSSLTTKLIEAGYAIVSSRAGGNEFTDPARVNNYRQLASVAMQHYRIQNVFLLADSMGAIPAVSLMASDYTPIRGLAAINPALDVTSATPQWPTFREEYPPNSVEQSLNPSALPVDSLAHANMRFYVSKGDAVVSPTANALAFKGKFGMVADISIVDCSGGHSDPSCVQPTDVITWYTAMDARARS